MEGLLDKAKHFAAEKLAELKKPEATVTDVDLKDVSLEYITYDAKEIASGSIPDPGSLKGDDTTLLDVGLKVPHSVLLSLVRDIGADWDIDYDLGIILIVDLPIFGNISIPITSKGEIKLPTLSDLWTK